MRTKIDKEDDQFANLPKNINEEEGAAEIQAAIETIGGHVQKHEVREPELKGSAKGRRKRKAYDTLNIPSSTFVELRSWRDALAATDPDRKWTYEAVLAEMMEALSVKNEMAYAKYKEILTMQDAKRHIRKRTAAMRKSSLKKKKKNLGYILLEVGGGILPCRLKIYPGKKEWKYGKEVRKPDYCHVPLHIPYDNDYPLLRAGKNIPVNELLKHPGAIRHQNLRPVTVGIVEIPENNSMKTYKLRKSTVTGKKYIVRKKKKQMLDDVIDAYLQTIRITYNSDKRI